MCLELCVATRVRTVVFITCSKFPFIFELRFATNTRIVQFHRVFYNCVLGLDFEHVCVHGLFYNCKFECFAFVCCFGLAWDTRAICLMTSVEDSFVFACKFAAVADSYGGCFAHVGSMMRFHRVICHVSGCVAVVRARRQHTL